MNDWLIVSFYTKNYKETAEKYLLNSLKIQGLPNWVEEVEDFKNWKEATDYKPIFVAKCLNRFWHNLIWVDCDATISSYPELFDQLSENKEIDIAYHLLDWSKHYSGTKVKKEFLSGTLYFRNNDKVERLVIEWIKNTKIYSPEQIALEMAIKSFPDLHTFILPRSYCYIATRPNGLPPFVPLENPIITHFQASRIERRKK